MAKNADHCSPAPSKLYVVATEKLHRIYAAEGHARNFFIKQTELGNKPEIIIYCPTTYDLSS